MLVAIRAASGIVEALSERQLSPPTPAQTFALVAASAHLRALARTVLAPAEGHDGPHVDIALGKLVSRTLALVDHALLGAPALRGRDARVSERQLR